MSASLDQSFFGIYENIVLTKNGIWLSNGEEILHKGTVMAFSRNIFRTPNGFELRIGPERKVIHVEDTLFFITSLDGNPEEGISLNLNDGRKVKLDPATIQYRPGRLTARVDDPNHSTAEEAKFLSASYHELLKHVEKSEQGFTLTIQGITITLTSA